MKALAMFRRLRQFGSDLWRTYTEWQRDDGPLLAAAVAYYTTVSFFPLLLVLISGFGLFLRFTDPGRDAQDEILTLLVNATSPRLERPLTELFEQLGSGATVSGPLGLLTLLLAAISIFAQFETAFDRVWNVEDRRNRGLLATIRSTLVDRVRAFVMLLGLGLLVLVIFLAGMTLSTLQRYSDRILPLADRIWWVVQIAASVTLNAAAFTVIYRVLPKAPVRWREAARGGVLAAVTWEIGRQILAALILRSRYMTAYGVVGTLIAVELWVYYASAMLFLGAEYVQIICRRCDATQDAKRREYRAAGGNEVNRGETPGEE